MHEAKTSCGGEKKPEEIGNQMDEDDKDTVDDTIMLAYKDMHLAFSSYSGS